MQQHRQKQIAVVHITQTRDLVWLNLQLIDLMHFGVDGRQQVR